ncbi:WXG100 family type VII secretion target [Streptomyces sp. XD-27]|uniref:WXG100 family type VII secretion target n=1 Tax=Streptomyces sp. XD-27 TaxID=3062779 RepID=UPI0026F4367B|nr:WXG100 family type VII secretion target [Streptomyces sp. XD-27]WKX72908.1 WXG100 family type VII secretion target [Streptomyces sp. XD-27]
MEITYAGVVEASNQVKSTADTIKSELDTLMSSVKAVVDTWDGKTQQAFYERQHDWNTKVNHLHQTLTTISRKLHEATEGYQSTDAAGARRFAG